MTPEQIIDKVIRLLDDRDKKWFRYLDEKFDYVQKEIRTLQNGWLAEDVRIKRLEIKQDELNEELRDLKRSQHPNGNGAE